MSERIARELIAAAEGRNGIQAGIADIAEVVNAPSSKAIAGKQWQDSHAEQAVTWLANAGSLLVLAMHHPEDMPELDWFDRGNTSGNRRLTTISNKLVRWLFETHGIAAQALPYQVEKGGVFLKDAACLAGLGIIGVNNLLITPRWGPRIRLRSVLIQEHLPPTSPLRDFNPCHGCTMPCRAACPEDALSENGYHRPSCMRQLESDREHQIESGSGSGDGSPHRVTAWCRRCEWACPVGRAMSAP